MFYLIRHGQADYSEKHTKIYEGVGIDFSPLSPDGIRQIKRTALDPRLKNAELILSSPYTRAPAHSRDPVKGTAKGHRGGDRSP